VSPVSSPSGAPTVKGILAYLEPLKLERHRVASIQVLPLPLIFFIPNLPFCTVAYAGWDAVKNSCTS